jgi:hypothetical protein
MSGTCLVGGRVKHHGTGDASATPVPRGRYP